LKVKFWQEAGGTLLVALKIKLAGKAIVRQGAEDVKDNVKEKAQLKLGAFSKQVMLFSVGSILPEKS